MAMCSAELARKITGLASAIAIVIAALVQGRIDEYSWAFLPLFIGLVVIWSNHFLSDLDLFDTETGRTSNSPPSWFWECVGWLIYVIVFVWILTSLFR